MHRPNRFLALCFVLGALGLGASGAFGDVWNVGLGNWTTPGSWQDGSVPGASDEAYIENNGTALVNSTPTSIGRLILGNDTGRNGTLGIQDGGHLSTTTAGGYDGWARVGNNAGTGTLNIDYFGSFTDTVGVIGDDSSSTGTVWVGGTWTSTSDLTVGWYGTGTLNQTGGTVSGAGFIAIGRSSGSTGTATVSAGTLSTNGFLGVGRTDLGEGGTGTLTVSGGTVTVGGMLYMGASDTLTLNSGSLTTQSFNRDASSTFNFYDGTLTVNGGTFTHNMTNLTLDGNDAADLPKLVLNNLSAAPSSFSYVTVGNTNKGELTISGGTDVTNTVNGTVGNASGSTGTVTVDGEGSSWNVGAYIAVGPTGTGSLKIQNGGDVTVGTNVALGWNAAGTGTAEVKNSGSTWNIAGNLSVGGWSGGAGGTGTLTISDSGAVDVGGTLNVWGSGDAVNFSSGTLNAATINHTGGGTFNFTGGTLKVTTFTGDLTNGGGTLAPGGTSGFGTTTFTTNYNYTQSAGTLALQLGSPTTKGTTFDALSLSGTGTLTLGGTSTLTVTLSGYDPVYGDTYDILDWGNLSGTFDTINLPSLSGGLGWDTSDLYTTGEITVTPEASTLCLFGVGLLGLLLVRRKRKREA